MFSFPDKPTILFRPDSELSHESEEIYNGQIHADELKIWAQEKCIPLVRLVSKYYSQYMFRKIIYHEIPQRNYI